MLINLKSLKIAEKETIYLSKNLADFFLIDCNQIFKLNFGLSDKLVNVKVSELLNNDCISLSKDLTKSLNTGNIKKCHININSSERQITLGPFLGILINSRLFDLLKKGELFNRAKYMFNAANEAGSIIFYFTCDNIRWLERKIKGITLDKDGNLKCQWFSFPKILYDRGVNFKEDEKWYVNFIRKQISINKNVSFINTPDYLDKWSTYKYLSVNELVKDLLPETLLYSSLADIKTFLDKYSSVYCKGRYGSKGNKIALVQTLEAGTFLIKTPFKDFQLKGVTELESFLRDFFEGKPFVLQQPIELFVHEGKKADMRILLCKDATGTWQVVYNQVRSIDKNSPVTNASKGGQVDTFMSFFINALGSEDEAYKLNQEICQTAIKVATALESDFGSMGEVGIDMALDQNLNHWFIEANTKPDNSPEPFEESINGVYPQFLYLIEYARYLDGFGTVNYDDTELCDTKLFSPVSSE